MKLSFVKNATIVCSLALLTACATAPKFSSHSGSKADGNVVIESTFSGFGAKLTEEDYTKAKDLAVQRCKAWNYKGAELFGEPNVTNVGSDLVLGPKFRALFTYQCTDK
ncbi:YecR family lipoprotein [uncultured Succinivibrio sp.]|uniref:YecR family lipoprotein n=1 Tax=uncultured Succinivibrio sp. TaxID=540749 RepID=UPI0025CD2EFC|nr:YecR family lipoprotein [uncultured Succinivibrio sp.]